MLTSTLIASCLLLTLSETSGSQDADKTVVTGKITSLERCMLSNFCVYTSHYTLQYII